MTKRVGLVTGASGLVGSAFVRRCTKRYQIIAVHHRAEVWFASQDQSFVNPLAPSETVPRNAHAVHTIRADLSKADEIERLVREVIRHSGQVDLVINAAAVRTASPLLACASLESAETLFAVNVLAPLRVAALLGRSVWSVDPDANVRENRNVINVSSTAGQFVNEDQGQAVYSAGCAALNHLTFHLASELWDVGVRVNAVLLEASFDRTALDAAVDMFIALDSSTETGRVCGGGAPT